MAKTAAQLDREITRTAHKHVAAIYHALYGSKNPNELITAVRDAQRHVSAMKRVARKSPNHPASSYFVDSRGEFDVKMYELANLLVEAKKHVKAIKKRR